jgi:hypothetical protein
VYVGEYPAPPLLPAEPVPAALFILEPPPPDAPFAAALLEPAPRPPPVALEEITPPIKDDVLPEVLADPDVPPKPAPPTVTV